MKPINKEARKRQKVWLEGYGAGIRDAINNNEEAIKIGNAIIEVLDRRYKSINNED